MPEKFRLDPKRTRLIRQKYPERFPVAVENYERDIEFKRRKFLVTRKTTVGELFAAVRRQVEGIKPHEALFASIDFVIPPTSALVHQLWDRHRVDDCLYVHVVRENTFG